MVEKERVCVTGAGGYQASWLVNLLLSQGYIVHGTLRDPTDEKNSHLKKFKYAETNLHLFKADLLDCDNLLAAIEGCSGVFHLASPVPMGSVPNPEVELIEPAVTGTSNVLKACSMANVKKVVVLSSVAAVIFDQNWPKNQAMDESCWSDKDYCRTTENWYCLSKTEAEDLALKYGKTRALNVVTVCPSIIIGPLLQSKMNTSSAFLLKMVKDGLEELENKVRMFVDVRDVTEALLLVYKKPEAEGRYICSPFTLTLENLVKKLKSMYPNFNYPKQFIGGDESWDVTSEKLVNLGWKYRPLEETLVDSIQDYQEKGLLTVT
ncbi:Cinnamoyl-coa reductase [Thalictrum thalictroides]|uniref:Cinnamoyl-coa reductase n=1 Tax=Thalictrum thalictroides TaxID=46969 RepID=A0A7J6UWS2_THATH|nr:Cinnamoyl-coa reductase [Thalictrum thalictroides]